MCFFSYSYIFIYIYIYVCVCIGHIRNIHMQATSRKHIRTSTRVYLYRCCGRMGCEWHPDFFSVAQTQLSEDTRRLCQTGPLSVGCLLGRRLGRTFVCTRSPNRRETVVGRTASRRHHFLSGNNPTSLINFIIIIIIINNNNNNNNICFLCSI